MNVLIATATYGNAMRPETRRSVEALHVAGGWQWYISRNNPYPVGDKRNYFAQYDHIRAKALAGNYDALLLVEHDMEVPPDALQALWDTGEQVAYGVYLLRHGIDLLNAYRWVKPGVLGESLSLYDDQLQAAQAKVVAQVSGIGFGCTLIRRETLERIPFRPDDSRGAPDMPFAQDCLAAGVKQVAHFGVPCGHWDEKREKMLQPFEDMRRAMQLVKALETVNISLSGGGAVRIEKGLEYHLPTDDALAHARTGLVELLRESTEAKGRILVSTGTDTDIRPAATKPAAQPAKSRGTNKRRLGANATG